MPNTYKIVWSNKAVKGFENIIKYISDNFSKKNTNKFISDFEDFIAIIETQPKAFPKTKKVNNIRRIIINKLTSVTYTIKKDTVKIITVYDNRTNNRTNN